jgi:hypothetical protein
MTIYKKLSTIVLAVLVCCFFLNANEASAAIVHGTAVTPGMQAGATTNISVTVATTPNPALFVSIFGVSSISSITYNGVTMTRLWQVQYGTNVGLSSAFILANPATGAHTLTINCDAACGSGYFVVIQPLYGVAQGNTEGTTWRTPSTTTGSGTTISFTAANTSSGDEVFDSMSESSGGVPTSDPAQTLVYGNSLYGLGGGASYKTATGANTSFSYTTQYTSYWSAGAVAIIPAPIPPIISSFTASPSQIASGATSTLSWNISGATSLSIDHGIGTVTGSSTTTPALTASTTYTITATNANGDSTSTASVTVDSSAPTVPQSFAVSDVSKDSATLTWAASTDNVGVTAYNVYRCTGSCVPSTVLATTTQRTYVDTSVASSTLYTYAVSAYDAVGNNSALSTNISTSTIAYDVGCVGTDITSLLQTRVNNAVDGDTITIGPGTCNISSVVLSTNKNIKITGQGKDVTNINATSSVFRFIISNPSKAKWRVTNMTIQGTDSSGTIFAIDGTSAGEWTHGWRIDHVKLNFSGNVQNGLMIISGVTYGLIDHNEFLESGGGTSIYFMGYMSGEDASTVNKLQGGYSASLPLDLGTYKAVYIEDNTFSNFDSGHFYAAIDSAAGSARVVVRYNTMQGVVYSHWTRSGEIGGIKYEIYNNVMTGNTNNQTPVRLEAGTGVVFNNTVNSFANQFVIDERRGQQYENTGPLFMCDGTHAWDGNIEATGWPCLGQIGRSPGYAYGSQTSSPLYAWNNGTETGCSTGGACTNSVNLTVMDVGGSVSPYLFLKTTGSPHTNGDVDYVNNGSTPMPGYTSFTYPYPTDASGMPSLSAKAISSFSFSGLSPTVTGTVDENAHTVSLTVPYGTNVTSLSPTISITGASVSPSSGSAQNFTSPVTYTVTASDSSTQAYTVTVNVASNTSTSITSFDFASPAVTGVVDNTAHTVALTVPYGTAVTSLTPTIALATGATISPLSGTSNNFSSPASYTVTAQDGTTQQIYTVTVTVSAAPVSSGGGGGGGGSSSGGSGYVYNYNQILNNAINNKTIQPVVNQSTSYIFTKNMTVNTRSTDIMTLQQFLNRNGYPVATSGPGSLGNETNYFGTLTFKALIRFQRSVGLPATGYFGPMTRELIKKSKVFK